MWFQGLDVVHMVHSYEEREKRYWGTGTFSAHIAGWKTKKKVLQAKGIVKANPTFVCFQE